MTAVLETFAKVRALHERTTNPGEKAAAATRMQTLARKAGMSVEQAVSMLDAQTPRTAAQAAADAFAEFFNRPEFVAERNEREARRRVEAEAIIQRYGSEDAVFTDTPLEAALRAACEPLLGPNETWTTHYRLDGWDGYGPSKMPASVRDAVSRAWPLPASVAEAWVEFTAADELDRERFIIEYHYTPHIFVYGRRYITEGILGTMPAQSADDMLARVSWMEFCTSSELKQEPEEQRAVLATLRADIERLVVHSGHESSPTAMHADLRSSDLVNATSPVHSGHPRRSNADKRRDVLMLLGSGLTDREIARRAGVSPQTVGNVRRSIG